MKTGFSLKKDFNLTLRTVLIFLLALVLIASAVLSIRMIDWARGGDDRISLSGGGANTALRVFNSAQSLRSPGRLSDENYNIHDDNTVWQTETEVDIFDTEYKGTRGKTVISSDGDKVVAPGTEGKYSFTIENTSGLPMYYELTFESWNKGFRYPVPMEARVSCETGDYLFGSATEWADFDNLAEAMDSKTLDAGQSMTYTLDWRWTFERQWEDWLDTALGNQSSYNEFHGYDWIECGVRIMTMAEIDELVPTPEPTPAPTPEKLPEPPVPEASGAAWALVNLICMILTVVIGVYEFVVFLRKHKDDEELSEEQNEKLRKRRKNKVWDLVPAVGSVVAFILTEDMRLPMTWVDKWTILMVVILLISGAVGYMTRLKEKKEEKVEENAPVT